MSFFIQFIIFIIVLFIYIHITNQYKKSEDMEIYEMDYLDNTHLQEVCEIKQPVLFNFKKNGEILENAFLSLSKYENEEINMKNVNEAIETGEWFSIPLRSFHKLIKTDDKSRFFSENNFEFMEETGLSSKCSQFDPYLKPSFNIQKKYDIIFGSKNAYTPIRFHTYYRYFVYVPKGKIQVKMTPYKSHKYLHIQNDYENYEFRSPIDVWNCQSQYLDEINKIQFLEFDVPEGFILYIPPYWFYSLKFSEQKDSLMYGFIYNSFANIVANFPKYFLYFLQQHNIQNKILKKYEVDNETKKKENQNYENDIIENTENNDPNRDNEIITNEPTNISKKEADQIISNMKKTDEFQL